VSECPPAGAPGAYKIIGEKLVGSIIKECLIHSIWEQSGPKTQMLSKNGIELDQKPFAIAEMVRIRSEEENRLIMKLIIIVPPAGPKLLEKNNKVKSFQNFHYCHRTKCMS
jgi:hypothetical protein